VWAMPDPLGMSSGADCMRTWVRSLCITGSYITVEANVKREGPVAFGWQCIDVRRKETPPERAGDPLIAFGTRYNELGRAIEHYFRRRTVTPNQWQSVEYTTLPDEVVQVRYEMVEPEQIAGVPWLASCLETIADLADYDKYELEAAKIQTQMSALIQAAHPELVVDPVDVAAGETFQLQHGAITAIPAGWVASFPSSTHPSGEYRTFRHERLRDLGLALGMPLMMILLSSAESNFASAHYDGAVYLRRLKARQAWIERSTLNKFVEQVVVELILAGIVARTKRYTCKWTWDVPPYVNPEKQRSADRMAMEDGALPLSEYCAQMGLSFEEVVATRARDNEILEEAGLPPVRTAQNPKPPMDEESDQAAEDDAPPSKNKEKPGAKKPVPASRD
jgi:capsid protein